MSAEADALGPEDYAALHGLLLSGDPQGLALAKKLTPAEQQAFFDYQQHANTGKGERTRVDSSVGGMPPELAIAAGMPVARAAASAVGGMGAKAAAGASSALSNIAAPQAKYWITKTTLEKMGVPSLLAEGAAVAISGYKKGAKGEPAAPEPTGLTSDQQAMVDAIEKRNAAIAARTARPATASPSPAPTASPVASAPAPLAPVVEPTAPPSAPPPSAESTASRPANALPDQKALNEEALARRRAEYQARTAAPPKPANVKLNAAETSAYLNLMLKGKTSSEAMASVLQQRELIATLGTPTPTPEQTRFPKGMRGKS